MFDLTKAERIYIAVGYSDLESKLNYKAWFCGHWHIDKRIDKMHFLMHGLEALSETK